MSRFRTAHEFEAMRTVPVVAQTEHFRLRLEWSRERVNAVGSVSLGIVTPKRWAKSAVRRNALRRSYFHHFPRLLINMLADSEVNTSHGEGVSEQSRAASNRAQHAVIVSSQAAEMVSNVTQVHVTRALVMLKSPFAPPQFRSPWSCTLKRAVEWEWQQLCALAVQRRNSRVSKRG